MLGNPESLSLLQILAVSACGLCTVFLCLGVLILAIKLLGILGAALESVRHHKTESAPAAEPLDEEIHAVLLSAVSAEVGLPLDKFRITSIREIDQ